MKTPILLSTLLIALLCQPAQAQTDLVGNRFRPLSYEEMTPAQKTMADNILAGPRTNLGGPFNVLLRSPEMGNVAQQLGAFARFNESLGDALREMAIIMTAKFWTAEFEWYAHKNAALAAGLDPVIVDAIAAGERPLAMSGREAALYDFTYQLLHIHRIDDDAFAAAIDAFGETGVVDIIGIVGYYSLVAMLLNADEYPLPSGVAPELVPLP